MAGEHIRTRRGDRWTHAIDCGDATVIHLANGEEGATRVRRSYRPEFVSGADAVEIVTHRERTFPAREVVARAYSRLGEPGLAAMFRDSEAFAEWCATGRLPPGPANLANAAPEPPAPPAPALAPRAEARAKAKARRAKGPARRAARAARPAKARRAKARTKAPRPKKAPARAKAKRGRRR